MARRSGYRLKFGSRARALLNYITYLVSIPEIVPGLPSPEPFGVDDWTAEPGDPAEINVSLITVPEGALIVDFRIDAGDWTSSGLGDGETPIEPGDFIIEGLESATEYEIELRSIGAGGASEPSDVKLVTTE